MLLDINYYGVLYRTLQTVLSPIRVKIFSEQSFLKILQYLKKLTAPSKIYRLRFGVKNQDLASSSRNKFKS
ncbi:hypothetical protein O181_015907 [Austropuccinia psidii MF-1]|uniref:Uncharacterized protein n=1 Tax=Austropuccinia psidii MF-1 TaxID=1389203 RepID=A0A9Q3C4K3_9BASI|nr:hypothetical protein [Austropuccinia psidii MF-1]